ncbi:UDP-glucose--hexose-1-phosphate uridylyltransferase [Candidatus Chloroploca asiatica]|uniref:Galactose-1-phosphate uridylyltransferase n=1 Tax=Candidatus Chloroploca asiatica TaxID=1506545 RepID=A0A2H3KLK8_9CHLR|nr:UDP-glucose--hexose-1-phosphate uridylyltransferase [Candidatus Chloroploca asiatica]PDV98902.1 galactose-1-phosphate uridylyltransferase [Candidatus Chloroploca asiatica]
MASIKGSHRRLNRLTGEWVVVSPHRTARPWLGQIEPVAAPPQRSHDPDCYLCPGNRRANGEQNPHYTTTFVFQNDYSALRPDPPEDLSEPVDSLLTAQHERGICRVICFSPRHDLTVGEMDCTAIRAIVDAWAAQYEELSAIDWVRHVQIFENRGAMMGASNPHPHGQLWGTEHLPNEALKELAQQRAYLSAHNSCLLCDYLALELQQQERIVCANDYFVALVPFWAMWPFETLVLPRRHCGALTDLSAEERDGLAWMLQHLNQRYDRLFQVTFPYSMGFHQRPTDGDPFPEWHLHAHFYPPLLRSATIRKFMVGYEMLGEPQRDLTPEEAAARLRAL